MQTHRTPGPLVYVALVALFVCAANQVAHARPEKIVAGESYYSDDYIVHDLVRDLAEEKNYEEVYQFYTYYEAIYDAADRVVTFLEYRRGEVITREEYRYRANGTLSTRTVKRAGKPPEITNAPSPDTPDDD